MKLIAILFLVAGLSNCSKTHAQTNNIYIEQVGSGNMFAVSQDGGGHTATIKTGLGGSVDVSSINISQQGIGVKTATVELVSGYSNSVTVNQDGNGQHSATVQNYTGSANTISITQTGSANNSFSVIGGTGTTNNANNINVTQSGNVGADKLFTLNMNGTNGATVTVQQTNPTQSNSGSMSIQCFSNCTGYSYIRN